MVARRRLQGRRPQRPDHRRTSGLERNTTDNFFAPTTGDRVGGGVDSRVSAATITFSKFFLDGKRYWTVTEDVLGRRSVFSLKGQTAVASSDTPIFERLYAGGEGSMEQDFAFRGVGPVQRDKPIGGDFLIVGTGEYEFPVYGKNLAGVVFMDAGDVESNISIKTIRVSAGFGIRLQLDIFGAPIPIALGTAVAAQVIRPPVRFEQAVLPGGFDHGDAGTVRLPNSDVAP